MSKDNIDILSFQGVECAEWSKLTAEELAKVIQEKFDKARKKKNYKTIFVELEGEEEEIDRAIDLIIAIPEVIGVDEYAES